MIELNLLPDVKKEFIRAQRTRNTVSAASILVTLGAAGILVFLGLVVYGGQALYISTKTSDIKKAHKELSEIPEIDKYLTVQNQLSNINDLHADKYIYSRAMDYLLQLNPAQPNNVALAAVTLTKEDNSLQIEGTARNFAAVSVFQTTLTNATLNYKADGEDRNIPLFSSVMLVDTGLANVEGTTFSRFEFELIFTEEAFMRTTTDPAVTVPNITTSDAARNAPILFGEKPEDQ